MGSKDNQWRESQKARQVEKADERIMNEVQHKCMADEFLSTHDLKITVMDGEVTLAGMVASPLLKDLAEQKASEVDGVVAVHNNIELGIGTPGEEAQDEQISSNNVLVSEGSNTGDPDIYHPTTTGFTEVQSVTREDVTGGVDSGTTAADAMQLPIHTFGEGSSVMDAGAEDAMKVSGPVTDEDQLAHLLTKGMPVVDRETANLGSVKEVRKTDFLLNRPLARDIYVPYYTCKYDGQRVVVDVLADEITDQGWAEPRLY